MGGLVVTVKISTILWSFLSIRVYQISLIRKRRKKIDDVREVIHNVKVTPAHNKETPFEKSIVLIM